MDIGEERIKMKNGPRKMNRVCRLCGCNAVQAAADARAIGFEDDFQNGVYTCCQVVQWADEQWLVWMQAAAEDVQPIDDVTLSLEMPESQATPVPVRIRRPQDPASKADPS
jgi:hypothetical protein